MRESKQRLEAQRQEYEGAIARHQVGCPEYSRVVDCWFFQHTQEMWIVDSHRIFKGCVLDGSSRIFWGGGLLVPPEYSRVVDCFFNNHCFSRSSTS